MLAGQSNKHGRENMDGQKVSLKESGVEKTEPMSSEGNTAPRKSSSRWLAVGALLSLGLALSGALQPSSEGTQDEAVSREPDPQDVARVGEVFLTKADLRRAVESQIAFRRDTMSEHELKELLYDLVEEELLMQRAQTLGLLDTDPALRRALVISMKEHVLASLPEPSPEQVESFYQSRQGSYGERSLDEIRPRVLRDLDRIRRQEALDRFVTSLQSETEVERFMAEQPGEVGGQEAGSVGTTEAEP